MSKVDADERNNCNPKSGTVVDRGVTMEKGWDFFLQAHAALTGTVSIHFIMSCLACIDGAVGEALPLRRHSGRHSTRGEPTGEDHAQPLLFVPISHQSCFSLSPRYVS